MPTLIECCSLATRERSVIVISARRLGSRISSGLPFSEAVGRKNGAFSGAFGGSFGLLRS